MDFFEGGVPIEGVNLRWHDTKILPDGTRSLFGILDARRLDTGLFLKLKITFGEKEPLQKMVVDLISRGYVKEEYEFQAQITATGPEAAQDALRRKRAEGPRDLSRDLPPSYTSGYQVLQTRERIRDQKGGPYRIINAKILPDETEVKIVTLLPERDPSQPMRMALMPSKDKFGEPQFQGIYLGEFEPNLGTGLAPVTPEPNPTTTMRTPETGKAEASGRVTSDPAGFRSGSGGANSSTPAKAPSGVINPDHELIELGYERIRGVRLISPKPEKLATMGELTDENGVRCIFMARRYGAEEEIRVYAQVPGANPLRDMLFKLDFIKNSVAVEHHGVIELPNLDVSPQWSPLNEADDVLVSSGYRRLTGLNLIHPRTGVRLPDTQKSFCIFNARDPLTGEELRIYADVPGGFPLRDLYFLELSSNNKGNWVEKRGQIVLPGTIPDPAPIQRPVNSETAIGTELSPQNVPNPGSLKQRVRFQGQHRIYTETLPRLDGTTEYFLILRARDLDTGLETRVKIYTQDPNPLAFRELTLEWARDSGGKFLCQPSDDPPAPWAGADLSTLPWERLRVVGQKTITPEPEQRGEDWEEEWHIFQARDVKTGGIIKVRGDVPGRDPKRKMTLIVRPYRWWRGEMQYEGALIEPDPDLSLDEMITMIERIEPPGLGGVLIGRIVERFKMESLYVIRYEPDLLSEIEGIGPGTIQKLKEADHLDLKTAIVGEMSQSGLNLRYFKTILDTFKESAVEVIRNRPYDLIKAPNVPFRVVDELAVVTQHRSETSAERISAVLSMTVENMTRSGKTGDWLYEVEKKAIGLVKKVRCTDQDLFKSLLWNYAQEESEKPDGLVIIDHEHPTPMIYFRKVFEAERRISANLIYRGRSGPDWPGFDPTRFLRKYEANKNQKLGDEQKEAISTHISQVRR